MKKYINEALSQAGHKREIEDEASKNSKVFTPSSLPNTTLACELKKYSKEAGGVDEGQNNLSKNVPNIGIPVKKTKGRKSICHLPSTEKCQFCDFVNIDATNKHQGMFRHYYHNHFQDKIKQEIKPILPTEKPFMCPFKTKCHFKSNINNSILCHILKNHGFMEKFIRDKAQEEKKNTKADVVMQFERKLCQACLSRSGP